MANVGSTAASLGDVQVVPLAASRAVGSRVAMRGASADGPRRFLETRRSSKKDSSE